MTPYQRQKLKRDYESTCSALCYGLTYERSPFEMLYAMQLLIESLREVVG